MTMMAFDADDPATDNAALRYNIVRQSPGNPSSNMFYIDAERGDIVTAISPMLLDREVGCLANSAYERMPQRPAAAAAATMRVAEAAPCVTYTSATLPASSTDLCLCEEGVHVSGPDECLSISTFN